MAVTTVIMFQIFYLLNSRSLHDSVLRIGLGSNPAVYVGIATVLLVQAAFIYLPPLQAVFGSAPLKWDDLLRACWSASSSRPSWRSRSGCCGAWPRGGQRAASCPSLGSQAPRLRKHSCDVHLARERDGTGFQTPTRTF